MGVEVVAMEEMAMEVVMVAKVVMQVEVVMAAKVVMVEATTAMVVEDMEAKVCFVFFHLGFVTALTFYLFFIFFSPKRLMQFATNTLGLIL